MKKVMLFSPVRGNVSTNYMRAVIALLNSSLCRGPNPPYKFEAAWTSGTSVAMARCEGADLFMRMGFDELVSWDVDLGVPDPALMVSMFNRLLSHDKEIVGAPYVGHNFLSQFHGAAASTESKQDDNGLLEMAQIPLGFAKVKREVFEKIKQDNPHLLYQFRETQMEKAKPNMFEFYPNGLTGPNTGQGKLERIRKVLGSFSDGLASDGALVVDIKRIVDDSDYSQSIMLGEDFYFCKLARDSGFKMYIDNNLIIPHESHIRLPVKNADILKALTEEWRLDNNGNPEEVRALVEKLRPHLNNVVL